VPGAGDDLPLQFPLVERPARVVAGRPNSVEAAVHIRHQDLLVAEIPADHLALRDVGDLSDADSCHGSTSAAMNSTFITSLKLTDRLRCAWAAPTRR
jgi:hypothetical protein